MENITELNLPSSVRTIAPYAFYGCNGLAKVDIPTGVTVIGANAFAWCVNLEEISLPYSLKEFNIGGNGYGMFTSCYNLKKVYCHAVMPPTTDDVLHIGGLVYFDAVLYVPTGTLAAYSAWSSDFAFTEWSVFQNIEEMDFAGIGAVEVADTVTVRAIDGRITVEGAEDAPIEVYAVNGSAIYAGNADDIPTLPHGVYIVRVAATTAKVVL